MIQCGNLNHIASDREVHTANLTLQRLHTQKMYSSATSVSCYCFIHNSFEMREITEKSMTNVNIIYLYFLFLPLKNLSFKCRAIAMHDSRAMEWGRN